jgi:NAD(P)-dependent dehydrogenase (short-subunit alcohol dehydrogenase family)
MRPPQDEVIALSSDDLHIPVLPGKGAGIHAYTASKGALSAFARAVAVDEARYGERVNSLSPGSVDTPMLRGSAELFGGPDGLPAACSAVLPGGQNARETAR